MPEWTEPYRPNICLNKASWMQLCVWLGMLALQASCGDSSQSGSPPRFVPSDPQTIFVGEPFSLLIVATDPDPGDLTFYIKGRPESAHFLAQPDGRSALFTWTPDIAAAQQGHNSHTLEFIVEDDEGLEDSMTVAVTVIWQWTPHFLTPSGYVLDLSKSNGIEFLVEVKDDAAAYVELAIADGPPNAYLLKTDKKKGYFSWSPDDLQIAQSRFWIVRLKGTGYARIGADKVETALYDIFHEVVIVLTNRFQEGCPGTTPTIVHTPVPRLDEQSLLQHEGYPVEAYVIDMESPIKRVSLFWSLDGVPSETPFQEVEMKMIDSGRWVGEIPALPEGASSIVHYYFEALDNDDYTGSACDRKARYPKQGQAATAVYGVGAEGCLNDTLENNDSISAASKLGSGSGTTGRLCGNDVDHYETVVQGKVVDVYVQTWGNSNDLAWVLLDPDGAPLGPELSGDLATSLLLPEQGLEKLILRFHSPAQSELTYSFHLSWASDNCPLDQYEPNQSAQQAVKLDPGTYLGLTICAGDHDYFRFDQKKGTSFSASLDFDPLLGDLDLLLLDEDGKTVLISSESSSTPESLSWNSMETGSRYLLVVPHLSACTKYNLALSSKPQAAACVDDVFSQNHHASAAPMLLPGSYEHLVACPGRDDWFALGLNGAEKVLVTVQAETSDLSLKLLDPYQTQPLCEGVESQSKLSMECDIDEPGNYKVVVASQSASANPYQLEVQIVETTPQCTDDRYEDNDLPNEAAQIVFPVLTWLKSCNQDEDWFTFTAFPKETLSATILTDAQGAQRLLRLFAPDGTTALASAPGLGGVEELNFQFSEAGDYLLKIEPIPGYDNVAYNLLIDID